MVKIIKKIIDIIFVLIIIALVGYYALRLTNKVEIFSVRTGSMEDGIHVGDYVLIYRKGTYGIGDIVTYVKDNYYVTHRIVKISGDKIITKGDANNTEDGEITIASVVGKVIYIGGYLNIIINYKYTIVGVLLALYLFSSYFDSRKEDKKDDKVNNKPENIDKLETIETKAIDNNDKENINNIETKTSEKKEEKSTAEDMKPIDVVKTEIFIDNKPKETKLMENNKEEKISSENIKLDDNKEIKEEKVITEEKNNNDELTKDVVASSEDNSKLNNTESLKKEAAPKKKKTTSTTKKQNTNNNTKKKETTKKKTTSKGSSNKKETSKKTANNKKSDKK